MRKKYIAAGFLCMACLVIFAQLISCGFGMEITESGRPQKRKEQDAVTIWAWDEKYNITAVKEAIKVYQQSYPDAAFDIVSMTQEEIAARLNSALLTGIRKALPDIALIEDYRIQAFLQNYESEFLELNDMVSESDFAACKTGVNQVGGRIYGVPFDSGAVGLFYRVDVIEDAGFAPEDMQDLTWEEFLAIGREVKAKTGRAMLSINPSDLSLIRIMMQSAGAWYSDKEGRLNLEGNRALAEAVRIYKEMVTAGIVFTVADWNRYVCSFQEGQAAAVISGSWIAARIVEKKEQSGLWRVAPVPRMQNIPESVHASSVGGSGWYVFKNAGHAQKAKQFLGETFASDTKLMNLLADKINLVSALRAAEDSENYKKGQPFFGGDRIYQDFIRWTHEIPNVDYGTDTYGIEELAAEILQQVLAGGSIEEILADYQQQYG